MFKLIIFEYIYLTNIYNLYKMDYRYLIALFLLLNICSFCNSEEENIFKIPSKLKKGASFLLHKVIRKDTLIALETYQRGGFLTPEGFNYGAI